MVAAYARSDFASVASSRQSSADRVVKEAAAARTAISEMDGEAQRSLTRVASSRTECNDQHNATAVEIEAVQHSVEDCLRSSDLLRSAQTAQTGRVDAHGSPR